jgi:hypothetical protein
MWSHALLGISSPELGGRLSLETHNTKRTTFGAMTLQKATVQPNNKPAANQARWQTLGQAETPKKKMAK